MHGINIKYTTPFQYSFDFWHFYITKVEKNNRVIQAYNINFLRSLGKKIARVPIIRHSFCTSCRMNLLSRLFYMDRVIQAYIIKFPQVSQYENGLYTALLLHKLQDWFIIRLSYMDIHLLLRSSHKLGCEMGWYACKLWKDLPIAWKWWSSPLKIDSFTLPFFSSALMLLGSGLLPFFI